MEAATARLAGQTTRNPRGALLRLRSDTFLVDLWALGDDAAFAELYRRHEARVFAICLGVLGTPHDAQDAVQEVWSSLATSMRESPPRELRPWLGRVARNAAIDIHRRRRAEPAGDTVEQWVAPERSGVDAERMEELVAGLKDLPERQRSALVLRELGGYSYPEIATSLGVEEEAVSGLVARARISLRNSAESNELSCSSVRQRLAEELDGRRRPGELRRHLRTCSGCREFHTAMKDDVKVLRSLTPAAAGMGTLGLFAITRVPKTAIGAGVLAKIGGGATGAKLAAFCVAGVCASAGVEEAVRHDVIPVGKKEASTAPPADSGNSRGNVVAAAATAASTPGVFGEVSAAAKAIPGADPTPERTAIRERVTGGNDGRSRREAADRGGSGFSDERPRGGGRERGGQIPAPGGRRGPGFQGQGNDRIQSRGGPQGGQRPGRENQGQGGGESQRRQGRGGGGFDRGSIENQRRQGGGGQGQRPNGQGRPGGGQERPVQQQPTTPAAPDTQTPAQGQAPAQAPAQGESGTGGDSGSGSGSGDPDAPDAP